MRGVVPDLLSVVLANILLALDFALICLGWAIFSSQRVLWWFKTGIIAGLSTLAALFTYAKPNVPWRILISSLAMSFYCLRAAWVAWRLPAGGVPRSWILLAALMGVGLFFLARGLVIPRWGEHLADLMAGGTLQALAFLVSFAGHILVLTSLVCLNLERQRGELSHAQLEVRNLSGLLPICSHCKRIRDDVGQWQPMDRYISARSDADFTHGICPQCVQDYYPEVAQACRSAAAQDPSTIPRADR